MFQEGQLETLLELNELRRSPPSSRAEELEALFAAEFGAHQRLAVYGSLAPGRQNHGQLSRLEGKWRSGLLVHGYLRPVGWGDDLGYPALEWSESAPEVPVELLTSFELPANWERLDRFEGSEYRRILVPLWYQRRVVEVANLYALG